jgi:hypothetical protein
MPMSLLFHQRIPLVPGTDCLVPVSELAHLAPEVHATALAKYDDTAERRRLRDTEIPRIGRLWTEVVFLSPVHPHAIWRAWYEETGRRRPPSQFWAIPAGDLAPGAVVLDRTVTRTGEPIDDSEVSDFDAARFQTRQETTPENRAWLASLASRGLSGAWFAGIPHVLVPGRVPLRNATLIDWADPVA